MPRKILFVLFADDECRQLHAMRYTLDLHAQGHDARLLLEGPATALALEMDAPGSARGALLKEVQAHGRLAGTCWRASTGCCTGDADSPTVQAARAAGIPLLDGMGGHAALGPFVDDGFEIVAV